MANRGPFTRITALIGAILVWLPLLAPVVFSAIRWFQSKMFLFDYLMPAEAFPLALVGGILLIWAAFRARQYRKLIGWSLGFAVVFLVGSQGLAVATGLASGDTSPGGWEWTAVLMLLAAYTLALLVLAVGGTWLVSDLFRSRSSG